MDYFYTVPELISGSTLVVSGAEVKHLQKVLRKRIGETVFVVDGKGTLYEAVIEHFNRAEAGMFDRSVESSRDGTLSRCHARGCAVA